jgi:hypothetical protein
MDLVYMRTVIEAPADHRTVLCDASCGTVFLCVNHLHESYKNTIRVLCLREKILQGDRAPIVSEGRNAHKYFRIWVSPWFRCRCWGCFIDSKVWYPLFCVKDGRARYATGPQIWLYQKEHPKARVHAPGHQHRRMQHWLHFRKH